MSVYIMLVIFLGSKNIFAKITASESKPCFFCLRKKARCSYSWNK